MLSWIDMTQRCTGRVCSPSSSGVGVCETMTTDPGEGATVAAAIDKVDSLIQVGRPAEALSACNQIISDYGADPALRGQIAHTIYDKGFALAKLGRPAEALAAFEQVIGDYSTDVDRYVCAEAWFSRGLPLWELGRHNDALDTYRR